MDRSDRLSGRASWLSAYPCAKARRPACACPCGEVRLPSGEVGPSPWSAADESAHRQGTDCLRRLGRRAVNGSARGPSSVQRRGPFGEKNRLDSDLPASYPIAAREVREKFRRSAPVSVVERGDPSDRRPQVDLAVVATLRGVLARDEESTLRGWAAPVAVPSPAALAARDEAPILRAPDARAEERTLVGPGVLVAACARIDPANCHKIRFGCVVRQRRRLRQPCFAAKYPCGDRASAQFGESAWFGWPEPG